MNQYIVYMEKGEQLDASAYLDYIEEGGETFAVSGITSSVEGTSESEQQSTASKQISMDNIEITSKVDTEKAGVYGKLSLYIGGDRIRLQCKSDRGR